ncbi:ATP-grasp domain-containing protein [soil metagenome]
MRPRVVALVSGTGWHVQDLRRASEGLRYDFEAIPFDRISALVGGIGAGLRAGEKKSLNGVDGVLVRMMPPGSLEQVVFRMDALQQLTNLGVQVLNAPRAIEAAVDKYLALAKLEAAGLPVPETWVGESATEALEAFEALGGDVVVKPLFGAEGRGLVRVSEYELARRAFHTLERLRAVLYVQKFIQHGADLRAFVLDGQVIGAMRRHAPEGDWRTNVAIGGRPEAITLDPLAERLALRAANAVGARMAGVDLLADPAGGGIVVLEVNAVPGWRALSHVTGRDVAAEVLAALVKGNPR